MQATSAFADDKNWWLKWYTIWLCKTAKHVRKTTLTLMPLDLHIIHIFICKIHMGINSQDKN